MIFKIEVSLLQRAPLKLATRFFPAISLNFEYQDWRNLNIFWILSCITRMFRI